MLRTVTATAVAVLMASATGLTPQAQAQGTRERPEVTHVDTVRELAAVCDPRWGGVPRLEAIAYCQGFLTSAGQYHSLLRPAGGRLPPLFCLPNPGPTIAQSGMAFAGWARANPVHGNEPALDGLLRWAQATYPCPVVAPPARRAPR